MKAALLETPVCFLCLGFVLRCPSVVHIYHGPCAFVQVYNYYMVECLGKQAPASVREVYVNTVCELLLRQ